MCTNLIIMNVNAQKKEKKSRVKDMQSYNNEFLIDAETIIFIHKCMLYY